MRDVLAIPLDEIRLQFQTQARQDVKVVAPRRYPVEQKVSGDVWRHGPPAQLVESGEIGCGGGAASFALAFANEHAPQQTHRHPRHGEIYFSERPLRAEYWSSSDGTHHRIDLEQGGVLIFAAGVTHRVELGGLTMVVEVPSVAGDKEVVPEPGQPRT